jgi:hypothetical protein
MMSSCGRLRVFALLMRPQHPQGVIMLWTIFVVILVLWLLGFSFHIAGGLIHILLVLALIVLIFNLISGRRSII